MDCLEATRNQKENTPRKQQETERKNTPPPPPATTPNPPAVPTGPAADPPTPRCLLGRPRCPSWAQQWSAPCPRASGRMRAVQHASPARQKAVGMGRKAKPTCEVSTVDTLSAGWLLLRVALRETALKTHFGSTRGSSGTARPLERSVFSNLSRASANTAGNATPSEEQELRSHKKFARIFLPTCPVNP